jgi:AraC-like DNA-binding protein
MIINFDERPSDSPFVERIWRSSSERGGPFTSLALSHWQLVIWQEHDKMCFTVRGPETKPTAAYCPIHAEFIGIVLKLGTVMPHLSAGDLVDSEVDLPDATSKTFWLSGSAWQFPTYENADTFIDRLVCASLLVRDPVVDAVLQNQTPDLSLRTAQRRFVRATGLTYGAVRQIERARHATILLRQGVSILDTVDQAGYADQSHLTRSLKRLTGHTPAQLMAESKPEQVSFLFKTDSFG